MVTNNREWNISEFEKYQKKEEIKVSSRFRHWCEYDNCGRKGVVFQGENFKKNNKGKGYKCFNCGKIYSKDELLQWNRF